MKCPRHTEHESGDERNEGGQRPEEFRGAQLALALAIVAVIVGGGAYLFRKQKSAAPTARAIYDLTPFSVTDPALIMYDEITAIPTGLKGAVCFALDPAGELIYVGGDKLIRVTDMHGSLVRDIPLAVSPTCLAVGGDGTVYAAFGTTVTALGPDGIAKANWSYHSESIITNIAVAGDRLFIADAGQRRVHVEFVGGGERSTLAAKDEERGDDGLIIYNPYLDVAVGSDGLVRVVDPGRHRLKLYDPAGQLISSWKNNPSLEIEGFSGCCNPVHIALLPDNSVVTSEKGIARVKLYGPDGRFAGVVVPPEAMRQAGEACDIAVDSRQRILMLDGPSGEVRVFVRKEKTIE